MTELQKKVINNTAPVTLSECVYMGDGTKNTVKDEIQNLKNNVSSGSTSTKYNGKKILWLGDSISAYNSENGSTYPKLVCDSLGSILTNMASSGGNSNRMRGILQGTISGYNHVDDISQYDYVFMMIGHNCNTEGMNPSVKNVSINDVPIDGTDYTTYDDTNFYCNVASCIEYIYANNQKCKIFLITPPQSTNTTYKITTVNSRKALKELGELYSVPVIDIYAKCGITRVTINTYTGDGTHLNNKGVQLVSDVIINYLLCH